MCGSSRPEVFCKKGVLRISQNSQEHMCQNLFFLNKVAGLRPPILAKERLWRRCFPLNFAKFPRTPPVAASVRGAFLFNIISIKKILVNFKLCSLKEKPSRHSLKLYNDHYRKRSTTRNY